MNQFQFMDVPSNGGNPGDFFTLLHQIPLYSAWRFAFTRKGIVQ